MEKRTMAIFAPACTQSLRNKRVQANQKPPTKKRQHVNKKATQANGGDGHSAVGQAADHHGIHDGHAHPTEFGEDERNGKPQRGADFGAKCLQSDHGGTIRRMSVSGAKERRKQMRWGKEMSGAKLLRRESSIWHFRS